MNNFFRRIRRRLANENEFQKYSRYAIGEIVLVVLGILIALQLNNWNEGQKEEKQFKVVLEQLYNSIKFDTEIFQNQIGLIDWQINSIDYFLIHPDSIPSESLPWAIFSLSFDINNTDNSETNYHASFLKYSSNDIEQNEISKQITNYVNSISFKAGTIDNLILPIFIEEEIPIPYPTQSLETNFYKYTDTISYYSNAELEKLTTIFNSHKFRTIIKTLRSQKMATRVFPKNNLEDALSVMKLIKNYYPGVRLIYQDVGIIGTAINGYPDVGAKSTPLSLTNYNESIWEIDMYLKEGTVKFRCRDSWGQNWGGDDFPKGNAEFDGRNIPIPEAGDYHVILNLSANTYEFIKVYE